MEYGMRAGRRRESQILLVVGMDHIDPPVRTNHREFLIEIAYGVAAGGDVTLAPTSTNGVMRADDALERLSFVHLYTVSLDRMRQNESVGLNSFRTEIGVIFVRCAKSRRSTAKASVRSARQDRSQSSFPVARLGSRRGCWRRRRRPPRQNIPQQAHAGKSRRPGSDVGSGVQPVLSEADLCLEGYASWIGS